MLEHLSQALFPNHCAGCESPIANNGRFGFCDSCYELLSPNNGPRCGICDAPGLPQTCKRCLDTPPAFERLWAPYLFGGPLQQAIHRIKFAKEEFWLHGLAELLCANEHIQAIKEHCTHIVPVPLGKQRLKTRGFNQSAVLARKIAQIWQKKPHYILERTRETAPQSGLSQEERESNMADAFKADAQNPVENILLIDDVVTTGATLKSAAQSLKKAGIQRVYALTLAHSDPHITK
ncbi:MAG: ComF family protein [Myxococcota bacterium]|nr:ComF family protein [Myxococcota bacterium]